MNWTRVHIVMAGSLALALTACSGTDPVASPSPSPSPSAEVTYASAQDQLLAGVLESNVELAQAAITDGADVNFIDDTDNTALSLAITRHDVAMVEALLDAGAMVEYPEFGFSELITAGTFGDGAVAQALLDAGADPDGLEPFVGGPLSSAALAGNLEVIAVLVEAGAYVDVEITVGERTFTPMISAAFGGHPEAVELLLDWGADPAYVMPDGQTAADWLDYNGDPELADYLRSQGG